MRPAIPAVLPRSFMADTLMYRSQVNMALGTVPEGGSEIDELLQPVGRGKERKPVERETITFFRLLPSSFLIWNSPT